MKNEYLVITGGSSGIGLAVAEYFFKKGFHIVNLSRTLCELSEVINVQVNMAQENFAENIQEELVPILEKADKIILVHNAARLEKDTVKNIEADILRDILEVNIVAPTILNRLLAPIMKAGSAIIYTGSTLSDKAVAGAFSYATCKHAVVGMMRATCQDLMGTGIHTACVCPGFTDTPMLRTHLNNDPTVIEEVKKRTSFSRLVEPAEIAEAIYFAANHPVLNGAVVHANLGQKES